MSGGADGATRDLTTDVAVIGAGPAGAVAAMLLARSGLDVLLVDRASFPRPKACGDCLSAAATELLGRLGVLDRVMALRPATLRGWRIIAPGGHECRGAFHDATALAVERSRLDDVLFRAALDAGARYHRARTEDLLRGDHGRVTGVVARTPDGAGVRVRARLVVGADGLRSIVARRLEAIRRPPRLRKVSLTVHARARNGDRAGVPGFDDLMDLGEMRVLDGGCIGFAPLGAGRFNITLVTDRRHAAGIAALGPEAFLWRWLAHVPALAARIEPLELETEVLASGPFDRPMRSAAIDGVALVGDAAGYYDPFTGQGVFRAMDGAALLAELVGPAVRAGTAALDAALSRYDRQLHRRSAPARRLQRIIDTALRRPRRADLVIRALRAAPALTDRLVQVTGDLRQPRSLLSPWLLSSLLSPSRASEAS